MSWDIDITERESVTRTYFPHCCEVRNLTWNNGAILKELLGVNFNQLHEKLVSDCVPLVNAAIEQALNRRNDPELLKLNPPNGWGGLEDVIDFLKTFREKMEEYPNGRVQIS